MGVSLIVDWPDGKWEEVFLGRLRQVQKGWTLIAMALGLELIAVFYGGIPVTPENLDPMLAELSVFRTELVRIWPAEIEEIKIKDRLIAVLTPLKETKDRSAYIG